MIAKVFRWEKPAVQMSVELLKDHFEVTGSLNDPNRRKELQGMPFLKGLIGPMWDGGTIRYEDQQTNDHLST